VSAFIGGKLLLLSEHQSTPNANMPFRFLSSLDRKACSQGKTPRIIAHTLSKAKPVIFHG
jgi:hypothetical protein